MKDFTLYPESLELKQLGFDEPCFAFYDESLYFPNNENQYGTFCNQKLDASSCSAPTYSQAFRWFRDNYRLNTQIAFCEYSVSSENSWKYTLDNPTNVLIWNGKFNTYEEAELECLKVLIEMVKTK